MNKSTNNSGNLATLVHNRIVELLSLRSVSIDVLADRVGALPIDEPFLFPTRLSTVALYAAALEVPIWELFVEPGTAGQ